MYTGKKLVELDPAAKLAGDELVYVVQGGKDRKTTTKQIAELAPSSGTGATDSSLPDFPTSNAAGQVLVVNAAGDDAEWSDALIRAAQTADTAQEDAATAQQTAEQALLIANDASATIQSTQEIALAAQSKAADAKSVADHALAVANAGGGGGTGAVPIKELPDYPDTGAAGQTLIIGADGASVTWSTALTTAVHNARVAQATADAAKTSATTADGKAVTAQAAADAAKAAADAADAKAVVAKTAADAAQHTADQALAAANAGSGSGTPVKELPDYPTADAAGQVLVVNQAGTGVEWSKQLGTLIASMATKITMGEENTLPAAKTTLVLDSGAPEFGLKNSAGEISLDLKADGSAGVMSKLGTASHSLILSMASGSYSIASGRISINSGGTVTLQVPPSGTASGNEVATAGFVLARLKAKTDTIDASIAGLTTATTTAQTTADAAKSGLVTANTKLDSLQTTVDGTVQNLKGLSGVWRGTQAEYDALSTHDDSTLYVVV